MSIYLCVLFSVKYLYIRSFIVMFQRSTTEDFSSFSVEYNSTPSSRTCLLWNARLLSVQSFCDFLCDVLKISLNASATDFPVLFFSRSIQPYFENTSITVRIYLTPWLNFENCCISTRSAAKILLMSFTNFIDAVHKHLSFTEFFDVWFVKFVSELWTPNQVVFLFQRLHQSQILLLFQQF